MTQAFEKYDDWLQVSESSRVWKPNASINIPSMRNTLVASILFGAAVFPLSGIAQELSYFEDKYHTKITGIAPKSEHTDLDDYYSQVANRLGIPDLAFAAVSEKYGWKKEHESTTRCIIRRSNDKWAVLLFRIHKNADQKTPNVSTYTQGFVEIDDTKKVVYCGLEQPRSPAAEPSIAQ